MWISKDEWEQLQFELETERDRRYDLEDKYYTISSQRAKAMKAMLDEARELKKENAALKLQLEKYKKLYADELQKRLELAEKVREMEGK